MSAIEVKMDGLNDLLRNLDVTKDIAKTATAAAMAAVSIDVANYAKANHTFQNRTQNLENSIQPLPVEVEDETVIGAVQASSKDKAGMEYAPFVELGTSRSAPYPFMQPAVEANKQNLLNTVAGTVERQLRGLKVET